MTINPPTPVRADRLAPWLCLVFLFLGMGWCLAAQAVVPMGSERPDTEPPPATRLSDHDARLLTGLTLEHYIRVNRQFGGQEIEIGIFRFRSADEAFSAFSLFQETGAKRFSDLADCYLQAKEMIFWKGVRVVRTTFKDPTRVQLSAYVEWLREQFKESAPVPKVYLQLPMSGRVPASRRFLLDDRQLAVIWPQVSELSLGLDAGNRLTVAQYRSDTRSWWGGWLVVTHRPESDFPRNLDGREAGPAGEVIRVQAMGNYWFIYRGPPDEALWTQARTTFQNALNGRVTDGEIDLSDFYRRDQYSYSNIIVTGLELVLVFLLVAVIVAVIFSAIRFGVVRVFHLKSGLARHTVTHLEIDDDIRQEKKKK